MAFRKEYVSQEYIREHIHELLDGGLRDYVEEHHISQLSHGLTMRPCIQSMDSQLVQGHINYPLRYCIEQCKNLCRDGVDIFTAISIVLFIEHEVKPRSVTINGKTFYVLFNPVSWRYESDRLTMEIKFPSRYFEVSEKIK